MKKSLGQYFLVDHNAIQQIVSALELRPDEYVIEIGPGRGALTSLLQALTSHYVGIEKDGALANALTEKDLDIIHGDALIELKKLVSSRFSHVPYVIVGNIPYYITGHLFRLLGELSSLPRCIILTVQKEVAERVSAHPPAMNLLAGSVHVWGDVSILFHIPAQSFHPIPRVDSSTIRIIPHSFPPHHLVYYKVLKALFLHPRKIAISNLAEGLHLSKSVVADLFEKLSIDSHARGHHFSVNQILSLAQLYQKIMK